LPQDAIARAVAVVGLAGVALIRSSDSRAWAAAVLLPLGAAVAFVISRTVGLPGGADDIGNWAGSLGLASLFVEGLGGRARRDGAPGAARRGARRK
jgi:hypothetical protein